MAKKKFFKNKVQMVVYLLIFAICIYLFVIIAKLDHSSISMTSQERMHDLYPLVDVNNKYETVKSSEVLDVLSGSGIVLFGFPENEYTNNYAALLNEVVSNYEIDKIYYYNFKEDRLSNNGTYEMIVSKLRRYLYKNDEGKVDFYAPSILIVKDQRVLLFMRAANFTNAYTTSIDYFTEETKQLIKNELNAALSAY